MLGPVVSTMDRLACFTSTVISLFPFELGTLSSRRFDVVASTRRPMKRRTTERIREGKNQRPMGICFLGAAPYRPTSVVIIIILIFIIVGRLRL